MTSTTEPLPFKNSSLHSARLAKNDEFYTSLTDVEREMIHYRDHFRGKTIYVNCDDPDKSAFWKHFVAKFEDYKLQRLISTHRTIDGSPSYQLEINSDHIDNPIRTELTGDGDFRSPEAIELLKQSDIIITNPPFSLFREYLAQLMEYDKSFIILGNMNAITYKESFPLIRDNRMWLGTRSGSMTFRLPDHAPIRGNQIEKEGTRYQKLGNIEWFTNLIHDRRYDPIELNKHYQGHETDYPRYDNYDAIEVSKTKDIPLDYKGIMGVPISFLGKHSPEQFEIIGCSDNGIVDESVKLPHFKKHHEPFIDGVKRYKRLFIRHIEK